MKERVYIIINSTILFIMALLLTTILHELAHAIIGYVNQSNPVIHHNFVQHFTTFHLTKPQEYAIAISGPRMGLIQGVIAGFVYLFVMKRNTFKLFLLWFSALGFYNFLSYLFVGPMLQTSAIGKAFLAMETPLSYQILLAIGAILCMLTIGYLLTKPFLRFSYKEDWVSDEVSKKKFAFDIIVLPWLIGGAFVTILYLPVVSVFSILYPILGGIAFLVPWQNAGRIKNIPLSDNPKMGKLRIGPVILLILVIGLFSFVLAPGIRL